MPLNPVIPTFITVHLGPPDAPAENITVPYVDYIKNVASSEIYPTWPENALRANIYAINTFALNRIYTEWYRSKGYPFDITNTTQYDQAFVKDRTIFENISVLVDELFDSYVVENGKVQPFFTSFCNGTTSTCNGLSQWGTVSLAEQGLLPIDILKNYYGDNINIIENAPIENVLESYPGVPVKLGDSGNDVKIIQSRLNAIANNYPAIGKIPFLDGVFGEATENSVKKFQEVFFLPVTGVVNKATWYKILRIYVGVRRFAELNSIGLTIDEAKVPFETELKKGSSGLAVKTLQYYLNVLAYFNGNLNIVPIDGVYGDLTENAVKVFQEFYSLNVDGIVGRETYNKLREIYNDILNSLPEGYSGKSAELYPGYVLTKGMRGENVKDLQTYLSALSAVQPTIGELKIDGIFGNNTQNAVKEFQRLYSLPVSGNVGPWTWFYLAQAYDSLQGV